MLYTDRLVINKNTHEAQYRFADTNSALAKLLYNASLFRVRQVFFGWDKAEFDRSNLEKEVFAELDLLRAAYPSVKVKKVLSCKVLEKLMRLTKNPDFFSGLPMQTAQHVLKDAVQDFKNWLAACKEYKKQPEKFLGKPKPPKYCKKQHRTFSVTNQDAVLYPVYTEENGTSIFCGMELKLPGMKERFLLKELSASAVLKEVKISPFYGRYTISLVLEDYAPPFWPDMPEYAGVDFGVANIATVVTTDGASRVYKGGAVKAENQLFAKRRADAASIITAGHTHMRADSRKLTRLSLSHACFMDDQLHKISSDIVRFLVQHRVGVVVLGTNKLWKQNSSMGKRNNQNFVSIPHYVLRWLITYKAQNAGITVIEQEESYTSKADITTRDFIPVYGKEKGTPVFSGKRTKRGLYVCKSGLIINADCNGAANILRKALPKVWGDRKDFSFLANPKSVSFKDLNRPRLQDAV